MFVEYICTSVSDNIYFDADNATQRFDKAMEFAEWVIQPKEDSICIGDWNSQPWEAPAADLSAISWTHGVTCWFPLAVSILTSC